jgi:ATP-binding cassette, subfamily B, bacterial MsbA
MTSTDTGNRVVGSKFTFDARPDSEYVAWPTFKRLFRECVLPHWRILAITIAAMAFVAATAGAMPFLLQMIGDDVFVAKDQTLVTVLPILVVVIITARAAGDWIATVAEGSLSSKIVADLRIRMFDTIAAADLAWIQGFHSGRFVSAFLSDVSIVDRAGTRAFTSVVKNGLTVLFLGGAMFYMDWRLSLIVLIGAPLAVFNLGKQKRRIRRATGRSLQETGNLNSMLSQTLLGMRVVKAYGQEANEAKRLRRIVHNLRKYIMKGTRSRAAVGPAWEAFTGIGIAAVIFYGGWQGIYGNVTLGHFMGFMTAGLLAFQPMKSLATTQASISEGLLAAQRVFSVIDYSSLVTEAPGAKPLQVRAGAITFRDVSFSYDQGGPVLNRFSLEVPAGSKLALVGPSGAGKSTVLNLILRFFDPEAGSILIDGQDLREATIASVRGASALLTQDPVLFDDTIGANIAYGSEWASEDAIMAAADAAAAHDFIMRLPDGYQTRVGEGGIRLSGGERQRIAFARAMLRNTPILLLDEPTSALDADSEAKVQLAMERLLQGRTVVMIAHRLSTVKKADIICCMENGRIVEAGTHAELVARRGRYAGMVEAQLLGGESHFASAGG